MKKYAVIVAGGSGSRMNSDIPKQFLLLEGKPVLMHTINNFSQADNSITIRLVLPKDQIEVWSSLCLQYNFRIEHEVIAGGITRFDSVKNGLKGIDAESLVAIHDGVRPLISKSIILESYKIAKERGSAIAAVNLKESIRKKVSGSTVSKNRKDYLLIQTPQTFHSRLIIAAYANAKDGTLFTDDASVFEANGGKVEVIDGDYKNIKITTPEDLNIAQALLTNGI